MREFRQAATTGKTKVWCIEQNGESHTVTWGLLDGKKQSTTDTPGAKGKEGTKAYKTPEEQCALVVDRLIVKKCKEGYAEVVDGAVLSASSETIDFAALPKNLCFYKPKNTIDPEKAKKLDDAGELIKTLKRDGTMHIACKHNGVTTLYSRRMDNESAKHPELIEELNQVLQNDSIVLGELVLTDENGRDDFKTLTTIVRSDPEKAIERQKEHGRPTYYIFDIAFWEGENWVCDVAVNHRIDFIRFWFGDGPFEQIEPIQTFTEPLDKVMKEVTAKGLEGLVVLHKGGIFGDKGYTFNGKAARPNFTFKMKPIYEDDFIARFDPDNGVGDWGNGKHQGKLGKVELYKLNDDGTERHICSCGGGFSDEQRENYSDPKQFPKVFKVKYDSIQPDTGSLRFPVFLEERSDKDLDECY